MKKLIYTSLLLISTQLQAETTTAIETAPDITQAPVTLVTINGRAITANYFRKYFEARGAETATPNNQALVLDELIKMKLLSDLAEKEKLTEQYEVKLALSIKRDEYLTNLMLAQFIQQNPITEDEITAAYNQTYAQPSQEYQLEHIQFSDEASAKQVMSELSAGGDFQTVANKGATELGWQGEKSLPQSFIQAISSMKSGETSQQPVKSDYGWHILKVNNIRSIPAESMDKLAPKIEQELQQKKVAEYLNELREKADIIFNPELINP